jgi:hypothetical protein
MTNRKLPQDSLLHLPVRNNGLFSRTVRSEAVALKLQHCRTLMASGLQVLFGELAKLIRYGPG